MRTIFHIDANSAYLSWTAAARLEAGQPVDLREIPSVIAGDPKSRHGIILAKSVPAKAFGIGTGESLMEARQKCPSLVVVPPDYDLYMRCSEAMYGILREYSPLVERYSIDECFLDYTASQNRFGEPVAVAHAIRKRIHKELGFTVNIGVSVNKLLAKMGSELKKPDRVHTLYPEEMEAKLWPLPVSELFMVGRATARKLNRINIKTIGQLASADPLHMKAMLKSHGLLVWNYANGIDETEVILNADLLQKGVGNSTTVDHDVTERAEAKMVLLSLTEKVGMRLRRLGAMAGLVSVSIATNEFHYYGHQLKLPSSIDSTSEIYRYICRLFDEVWKGEPIRKLGVAVSDFCTEENKQLSFFEPKDAEKCRSLDRAVDQIRCRYGDRAVTRGIFANSECRPIEGGTHEGPYIMMGGYRQ